MFVEFNRVKHAKSVRLTTVEFGQVQYESELGVISCVASASGVLVSTLPVWGMIVIVEVKVMSPAISY
jgi:hypothetical protein